MVEEETKQISKYNDSLFSISRLNESWLKIKRFLRVGNFKGWRYELDIIWIELYPDVLRKQKKEELSDENKSLMEKIAYSKGKNELFFNLMERTAFLRKVQDMAGKAGVYINENEEGFE